MSYIYNLEISINDLDLSLDNITHGITEDEIQQSLGDLGDLQRNRYNSFICNIF